MKKETTERFSRIFLLEKLVEDYPLNVMLEGDDKYLEPILEKLTSDGLVEIDMHFYQLTALGREKYDEHLKKYLDFLVNFDIYSAIDLQTGIFAFEKYWDIESEEEWSHYLNQENFHDLRIVVAEHKGIDPYEMVFLSFINEDRLAKVTTKVGWQFDIASGEAWKDIEEIVKTAIKIEELAYQYGNDYISGEAVLTDIIKAGSKLNLALWENEGKYFKEEYDLDLDQKVLSDYKDVNYVNPIWQKKII